MKFNKIGVIGKFGVRNIESTLISLRSILEQEKLEVLFEDEISNLYPEQNFTAADRLYLAEYCDLVIVVGGDGSFLDAARFMAPWKKPMLGINLGRLGFLTDIAPESMHDSLKAILHGEYKSDVRFVLQCKILREGKVVGQGLAMNDVVLHKWKSARMIEFETIIDGEFVNTQRADGVIVSTPTGSTAYALSGGGPILEPSLEALTLVSICPHTLSNRPLVVRSDKNIEIVLIDNNSESAQITCDGQINMPGLAGDVIEITRPDYYVELIHPKKHEVFEVLRAKLGWSDLPKQLKDR